MSLTDISEPQKVRRNGGPSVRSAIYSPEALERKRAADREYDRRRWATEEHRRAHADRRHKRLYGISLDERDEMERQQEGRCLICLEEKKLVVDHCHATGRVRGLLCFSCNKALGFLKDDLQRIERVIDYLARS